MMTLSRIALVQWHLLARADLDIVGNGAILGENRSGKSTLIDLIQTVMSGGAGGADWPSPLVGEGGRAERGGMRGSDGSTKMLPQPAGG